MGSIWKTLGNALAGGAGAIASSVVGGVLDYATANKQAKNQLKNQQQLNAQAQQYNLQNMQQQYQYNTALGAQQNAYAQHQMALQNDYNVAMFNMENEYNAPAAQRGRMAAAGLNPNFADGQAVAASGESVATPSGASPGSVGLPSAPSGSAPEARLSRISDLVNTAAGIQSQLENAKGVELDNETKSIMLEKIKNGELIPEGYQAAGQPAADLGFTGAQTGVANSQVPLNNAQSNYYDAKATDSDTFRPLDMALKIQEAARAGADVKRINAMVDDYASQISYREKTIELGFDRLNLDKIIQHGHLDVERGQLSVAKGLLEVKNGELRISAFLANHMAKKYDSETAYNNMMTKHYGDYLDALSNVAKWDADLKEQKYGIDRIEWLGCQYIYDNYPQEIVYYATQKFRGEFQSLVHDFEIKANKARESKSRSDILDYQNEMKKFDYWWNKVTSGFGILGGAARDAGSAAQMLMPFAEP